MGGACATDILRSIINLTDYEKLTSAWSQDGVAAKVSDLDHHTVVHHTVGGLEATVNCNVTGVEVRHALWKI